MGDEIDGLKCGSCGAPIDNEALVAGACQHCGATLQLPRKAGEKRAHVVSEAGEDLAVRVSDDQGERVLHFEGIVMDPSPGQAESKEAPRAELAPSKTEPDPLRSMYLFIAIFVVIVALASGIVFAVT